MTMQVANSQANPQMMLKAKLDSLGFKKALADVLPKHVTPDRVVKVVLSATARNPDLLKCSVPSIMRSIMQAAELGLEIGGLLGEAYLVPFKGEATCIVGYRGLINLARRSGQIASVSAHVVHAKDDWEVDIANDHVRHSPCMQGDPGEAIFVYATARFRDGSKQLDVMTMREVELIRSRSRARSGPWVTDYEEMAKKTVVRRLSKYLPLSPELQKAIEYEVGADAGHVAPATEEPSRVRALTDGILSRVVEMADEPAQVEDLPAPPDDSGSREPGED